MKRRSLLFLLVLIPPLAALMPSGATAAPGDADRAFNKGGTVQTPLGASSGQISYDSLTQPDGKIVMVGRTRSAGFGIAARYLPDGKLDKSFGDGGSVEFEGMNFDSVALDDSGRIVIAGHSGDRGVVTRLLADGTLDSGFGDSGLHRSFFAPPEDQEDPRPENPRLPALAVLPDGSIFAAGSGDGCGSDCDYMLLMRLDGSGEPLPIAGQSGVWSSSLQELSAIDILPDGRLVVVDRDSYSDGYDNGWDISTVYVYEAPAADGSLELIWRKSTPGSAPRPGGGGTVTAIEGGGFYLASGAVIYKATANGPDPSFGRRGVSVFTNGAFHGAAGRGVTIEADSLIVDSHGNLVVAGLIFNQEYSNVFVARLTSEGKPDPTFDNEGIKPMWGWNPGTSASPFPPRILAAGDDYRLTGTAGEYGVHRFGISGLKGGTAPSAKCDGRPATWLGTGRREDIYVNSGVIVTLGGNDEIHIGRENESTVICAGTGNDRIHMKGGTAFGEAGKDRIEGSNQRDRRTKKLATTEETMHGGPGSDFMRGFGGDDRISGGDGPDTLTGGEGEDDLFGGRGRDELSGEEGNDHLFGGPGRDYLEGGPTIPPRSYYSGTVGKTRAELVRIGQTFVKIRVRTHLTCDDYSGTYGLPIREPVRITPGGKIAFSGEDSYDSVRLEGTLRGKTVRGRYSYTSHDDWYNDDCWTGRSLLRPWVRFEANYDRTRRQVVKQ